MFWNDKVGMALMFALPIVMVFIITIVQESAFDMVNSNKIEMLIVNHDEGTLGNQLAKELQNSGMFDLTVETKTDSAAIVGSISNKETLTAIYIAPDFTKKLTAKSQAVSDAIMADFGLGEQQEEPGKNNLSLKFYYDPVLQEGYSSSIINMIYAHVSILENGQMIGNIYDAMGLEMSADDFKKKVMHNQTKIERISAASNSRNIIPNSSQHNVPSWTIFAMFFMVVSLGVNVVKERNSGSFMRLKTLPSSFALILFGKQFLYFCIALLQVFVIFSIGLLVFPLIGLPELSLPDNMLGLIAIVFACSFAAISYALMIGTIVKTQEQANGLGSISVIIFAALGGIWVPTFLMPDYMYNISLFSPLHWCLEGFYILFLRGGSWSDLLQPLSIILSISIFCQIIAYVKLKIAKIL